MSHVKSIPTHHFNSMNHPIPKAHSYHVKTHESQFIIHLIHAKPLNSYLEGHTKFIHIFNIQEQGNSSTYILLTQPFTQAEEPRSSEHPPPRRGLESGTKALSRPLAEARPPRLSEMGSRSKLVLVAWATVRSSSLGELLLISPRRDVLAWARQPEPVPIHASRCIQTDQNMFLTTPTHIIVAPNIQLTKQDQAYKNTK